MAKVVYYEALKGDSLSENFSGLFETSASGNGKSGTIEDFIYKSTIELKGKGIVADSSGTNGSFSHGSVDELVFKGSEGDKYVSVTGHFDAAKLGEAASNGNGFGGFLAELFKGNDTFAGSSGSDVMYGFGGKDTIFGKAGKDFLDGGAGDKDKLTGGADSDQFLLRTDHGKDIVTDFEIKGNKRTHDYINIYDFNEYKITEKDGNVVISVSKYDSLTLRGVSEKDFDEDHFIHIVDTQRQDDMF